MFTKLTIISLAIFSAAFSGYSFSEIYKYQDKSGRWVFTDKPLKQKNTKPVSVDSRKNEAESQNIKVELVSKFKPRSKVEEATLAVVKVETHTGNGSGFFVSTNGFIVTNRHVIRPSTTEAWKVEKENLKNTQSELNDFRDNLDHEKARLKDMKEVLEEEKKYVQPATASNAEMKRFERYISRYEREKKQFDEEENNYKEKLKEYEKRKSQFDWNTSLSGFSKKFDVILKNGKKYSAHLVKISDEYDLALLRIKNQKTPHIALSQQPVRQGEQVYAIGSPLGMTDSLTAGIITKLDERHIVTDTRILPGNSGGPLINSAGEVVGVNTAVISENEQTEGLGLSLYVKYIKETFRSEIQSAGI